MSTSIPSFTEPTIVTSDDLNKRSYVTFYFNNERVREYHGKSIGQRINPNRAKSLEERSQLLKKLQFELHKALDANCYPVINNAIEECIKSEETILPTEVKISSTIRLLFEATRDK